MRADRLLSILLLLQARGRMTAADLAAELECCQRTIYRDIDALSASGVPVFGETGPGGGFALLDRYRTTLTGLTTDEVRALFMLSIPEPLARLGVDKHLRAAMRKLAASLPDARRADEQRVRQRFLLDATWWLEDDDRVPHMQLLQEAVWHDRTLLVTYRAPVVGDMTALIEPYGLVAKAGLWHLVFGRAGRTRVERVSALLEVHQTGEAFDRPAGFDLESFWREWCAEHQAELARYRVTVRVRPGSMAELRWRLGSRVRAGSQPGAGASVDGGECLDLTFESLEEAREKILGLGRGVEVIHPFALRRSVRDYAAQVLAVYDSP